MKILVAEDDTSSRLLLRRILKKAGFDIEAAKNGQEAFDFLKTNNVDVLLADWMMPEMDGIELIQKVRKMNRSVPYIIVITALSSPAARAKALDAGADDYLTKPYQPDEIIEHIENGMLRFRQGGAEEPDGGAVLDRKIPPYIAVAIASSTGGPSALRTMFSKIAPTKNAVFFIVQHGPAWMLETFVSRLQGETSMKVLLGEEGMEVHRGDVILSPGDYHMVFDAKGQNIHLTADPPENFVRPAADPLFRSIAKAFGSRSLAVVLTGMGRDGTIGSGYISAAGGTVIAQDPKTATLPSMPQSVIDLRIAQVVAPLEEIGACVSAHINRIHKENR